VLPSDATTVPAPALLPDDITPAMEKAHAEAVAWTASNLRQIIKARLTKMELTLMRRLKLDEKSAEHLETLFHFKPGDLVLRRTKVLGKLASKAEGPYVVVKIGGSFH